ncbi:MAG: DUF3108 domain-containing protein [Acidobacteria bacterium]|nr:DUF3108 domain-containing protein [Acidobacteriota bacterium]
MTWLTKYFCVVFLLSCAVAGMPSAAAAEEGEAPFSLFDEEESLTYRLLWPSGVMLGEAVLRGSFSGDNLHFQLTVEAGLPQYNISYSSSSVATKDGLCSLQFQGNTRRGSKALDESIEFDPTAHLARRTRGNQTTSASIPECARDPLTFLYYFRNQLALGKTLDSGTFHLGANFSLQIEAAGPETVDAGGRQWPAEKYRVTYRGPNSERTVELWISTDATPKPVRVRVAFPLAVFSAELE